MDNTEELLKSLEENIKKDAKRREPYVKALIKRAKRILKPYFIVLLRPSSTVR